MSSFRAACTCQGTDSSLASFETTVCGTAGGTLKAVCSDGDDNRDFGGYGWAIGTELNFGVGAVFFAGLGPAVNGRRPLRSAALRDREPAQPVRSPARRRARVAAATPERSPPCAPPKRAGARPSSAPLVETLRGLGDSVLGGLEL